jgi:heme-degrading monooxygenase HmoA
VNYITCRPEYVPRFKQLFATRARAIDRMPGFCGMHVLEPAAEGQPFLIVSYWREGADFERWTGSEEFKEGHARGFADMAEAKRRGDEPPLRSEFRTYCVIAR